MHFEPIQRIALFSECVNTLFKLQHRFEEVLFWTWSVETVNIFTFPYSPEIYKLDLQCIYSCYFILCQLHSEETCAGYKHGLNCCLNIF